MKYNNIYIYLSIIYNMECLNLITMTKKELVQMAKQSSISNTNKNKSQLIEAILNTSKRNNVYEILDKLKKEYRKLYETYKKNKIKNGYTGKFLSPQYCNNSTNKQYRNNCDTIINQLFRIWIDATNNARANQSIKNIKLMITLIKVQIKKNNKNVSYYDLTPSKKNR